MRTQMLMSVNPNNRILRAGRIPDQEAAQAEQYFVCLRMIELHKLLPRDSFAIRQITSAVLLS